MPLLLRTVKHNRWFKEPAAPFLANDDIPGDCLGDMNTSQNQLSVWELAADRSNLERVVRAVAAGRDRIDHTGYIVFDSTILEAVGIEITNEPGTSPDSDANVWHRDIVLTGNKMVALAKAILRSSEEAGQVLKTRMKQLIRDGIEQGQLPISVQEKFQKK